MRRSFTNCAGFNEAATGWPRKILSAKKGESVSAFYRSNTELQQES